jgi:hypothetical protein
MRRSGEVAAAAAAAAAVTVLQLTGLLSRRRLHSRSLKAY